MPLNRPSSPSFLIMNCMTSIKLLNGFPCREGGGLDWSPTFATISGCVAIVARDFEIAPRTAVVSTHQC